MSGPKVMRVRWLLLESAAALDELAEILNEWKTCLKRYKMLTPDKVAAAEATLRELERLREARRWRAVLNGARSQSQALRHEMEEVRAAALRRAEEARHRRRRLQSAARTVSEALAAEGK